MDVYKNRQQFMLTKKKKKQYNYDLRHPRKEIAALALKPEKGESS